MSRGQRVRCTYRTDGVGEAGLSLLTRVTVLGGSAYYFTQTRLVHTEVFKCELLVPDRETMYVESGAMTKRSIYRRNCFER